MKTHIDNTIEEKIDYLREVYFGHGATGEQFKEEVLNIIQSEKEKHADTERLSLVNRKMDNDIYKIIEENEGDEISKFVVALKKYIISEKEEYAEERVREFAYWLNKLVWLMTLSQKEEQNENNNK